MSQQTMTIDEGQSLRDATEPNPSIDWGVHTGSPPSGEPLSTFDNRTSRKPSTPSGHDPAWLQATAKPCGTVAGS